ncbi:MAG TPA: hypothetical protein DCM05_05250 [Elusimicrobia bacterium]|nr:hypothetical protein [Elusimicrobiota bacterium]
MPRTAFALLLAVLPSAALAASHTVEVRVSNGKTAYAKKFTMVDREQGSHVLPVKGKDGRYQEMIFNGLLAPLSRQPGAYELQYQVELSGGRDAEGPSIQSQSDVVLRAGEGLNAVECGSWKIDLLLDGGSFPAKNAPGNLRVGAELTGDKAKIACRQVVRPGAQANVADSLKRKGKKHGLVFNLLPGPDEKGVFLQYQLSYTPLSAPKGSFQTHGQETLILGKKSVTKKSGYQLALTAEGRLPEAERKPAKPDESQAVPMLR